MLVPLFDLFQVFAGLFVCCIRVNIILYVSFTYFFPILLLKFLKKLVFVCTVYYIRFCNICRLFYDF